MKIGIDGNEANVEKRVGISEYTYWLLYYFAKFRGEDLNSNRDFSIYLKNNPIAALPEETEFWHYSVFGPSKFWSQFALPANLFLKRPRPSVFFSPGHYSPRFSPVPTVVSVMDVSYLYFPELFKGTDLYQLKHWTAYSVKNASRVLTISNSTKNDIIKEYHVPKDKVSVVYPGIKEVMTLEPHVFGMNQLKAKYNLSDSFILFVGTLQPRKNISRLIEAFSHVLKKDDLPKDLELVVIGKKGWLYEDILAAPEKYGVTGQVKFLENVTDDELAIFYQHALCYVLPSLYEGFGLPVLEAMKHGCPVVTSNISSLPEAGGDAALYVDPKDVDDIAKKIIHLVRDEKLRHEFVKKGKEQVTKFSWEKTARETLQVLEEVAKKKV